MTSVTGGRAAGGRAGTYKAPPLRQGGATAVFAPAVEPLNPLAMSTREANRTVGDAEGAAELARSLPITLGLSSSSSARTPDLRSEAATGMRLLQVGIDRSSRLSRSSVSPAPASAALASTRPKALDGTWNVGAIKNQINRAQHRNHVDQSSITIVDGCWNSSGRSYALRDTVPLSFEWHNGVVLTMVPEASDETTVIWLTSIDPEQRVPIRWTKASIDLPPAPWSNVRKLGIFFTLFGVIVVAVSIGTAIATLS